MKTETDMETVMETRTWKRQWTWKRKWTWKCKRKLYFIQRNSPYSFVRIVANM
jgi:hypothetical protein